MTALLFNSSFSNYVFFLAWSVGASHQLASPFSLFPPLSTTLPFRWLSYATKRAQYWRCYAVPFHNAGWSTCWLRRNFVIGSRLSPILARILHSLIRAWARCVFFQEASVLNIDLRERNIFFFNSCNSITHVCTSICLSCCGVLLTLRTFHYGDHVQPCYVIVARLLIF